jgi:L,D-transpeptidase ErfK/SrfK
MRSISVALIALLAWVNDVSADTSRAHLASGLTGGVSTYATMKGDTLQGIGARFGIDAATLAADNALKANAPLPAGLLLRVDNRHLVPAAVTPGAIVVNVPQRMLFFEWEHDVTGLPVAIGQPTWKTPRQAFTVLTKETNPTWDVPPSIQEEARRAGRILPAHVPPGPNNPLGRFWLGLSIPGVGIHGTNAPSSIYRAATHGCIRVGPDDIAWLFERVIVGTPGQVIYEPILLGVVGGDIFLEVHRDIYRELRNEPAAHVRLMAAEAGLAGDIDWDAAAAALDARRGIATRVGQRRGSLIDRMFSR